MRHLPALTPAALIALAWPGAAAAHAGHLTDLAGHDHWVAGAAIGVAIALGLWGALKGGGDEASADASSEAEAETGDEARA